jgi:hypothetical protein
LDAAEKLRNKERELQVAIAKLIVSEDSTEVGNRLGQSRIRADHRLLSFSAAFHVLDLHEAVQRPR